MWIRFYAFKVLLLCTCYTTDAVDFMTCVTGDMGTKVMTCTSIIRRNFVEFLLRKKYDVIINWPIMWISVNLMVVFVVRNKMNLRMVIMKQFSYHHDVIRFQWKSIEYTTDYCTDLLISAPTTWALVKALRYGIPAPAAQSTQMTLTSS